MERRLFVPGRYAREMREKNEAMRRGEIPPQVDSYDLTNKADQKALTRDLKASIGDKIILPWNTFSERAKQRAEKRGVYRDEYEIYSRDIVNLDYGKGYFDGREDELVAELQKKDSPENYLIVRYPWLNAFVKVPRQPEFKRITQSREYGIISEKAQEGLRKDNFLVIGGGVGGRIAVSLAGAGAEHITIVDASPINPHRGSRVSGPFVSQMGENQATYYVKQMLELNPHGDYKAIPKFIGDPLKNPDAVDMNPLIDWSDFILQEIDQLDVKREIHVRAQKKRKLCAQITDAGTGTIIMLDDPNFIHPPFNGRLTPEVHLAMQQMDLRDKETFLNKAVEIYMGHQNISPEFAYALNVSKEAGYSHIPQSGIAANKAGAEAVKLYCDLVDGKITGPIEKLAA